MPLALVEVDLLPGACVESFDDFIALSELERRAVVLGVERSEWFQLKRRPLRDIMRFVWFFGENGKL